MSNTNERGNVRDRRTRRAWLLRVFASDHVGFVRCYRCGLLLDEQSLTIDRIIPGRNAGSYKRDNIRPACRPCNRERG